MTKMEDEILIGALVKDGLLRKDDLTRFDGLAEKSLSDKGITKTLVSLLGLDEEKVAQIIANEFNVPIMPSVDGQSMIHVPGIPIESLSKYRIVPLFIERKELTIAFVDPPYNTVVELLEKITKKRIIPVIITVSYFQQLTTEKQQDEVATDTSKIVLNKLEALGHGGKLIGSKISADLIKPVDVMSKIVEAAIESEATDIHIENSQKGYLIVRFRIAGLLSRAITLPKSYTSNIQQFLRQSGSLDSFGKTKVRDGLAKFDIHGSKVHAKINVLSTSKGEIFALRILNKNLRVISLNEIGMFHNDLIRLRQLLKMADGIILFVGPAGCGKTTTMYASLNELKDDAKNIATIENPIESEIDGINQISYGSGREQTFTEGAMSLLHHDFNVMGVSEIQDKEGAELLLEAGITGKLAMSTIQAPDAIRSLYRLQNLGVNRQDLSYTIRGVVAQRFVRRICPYCSENFRPEQETLELAGLALLPKHVTFARGKGCVSCMNTGYLKRAVLVETLIVNEEIGTLIHKGGSYGEMKKLAEKTGFTTMRYDGLRKALAKITTLDEVIRVT